MYGIHREIHTSPFYKVSSMPLQLRVLREVQTPIANHWTSLYGMSLAGFAELESYPVGACTAGYILQKVVASLADGIFCLQCSVILHTHWLFLWGVQRLGPQNPEMKLISLHEGVSQRPSASPSPAKGRYWTLFIQDKEPAGPCRLQGCHNEVFP